MAKRAGCWQESAEWAGDAAAGGGELSDAELEGVSGGVDGGEGFDFVQVNGANGASPRRTSDRR